ncbi:hypothetical protein [Thermoactinomyces mirandus]|uniref:hypothetical protein n=1 Tax=Thermoactinomyces mirandus TaxID=2756294 RepID=UPI001C68FE11|nr:hypothetical protein [Thermoactinomyces mirandus]
MQCRIIYTDVGRLSFMIATVTLKRSLRKSWTKLTEEMEKEYAMRKNQEMAI